MARTKKITDDAKKEVLVSEDQVWTTLEFAQALGGLYPAVFNPSASVNPLTFNIGYLAVFVVFGVALPTVTIKNLLGSMRSL